MANMVFTASRSAGDDINVPISIPFTVGGTATFTATATSVSDYTVSGAATFTATNGSMVIPAGQASAAIIISTIPDTTPEPDETIILTPTAQAGSWIVGTSAWVGTILNDDVPTGVSLTYVRDGDTNGLFYYLGTNRGTITWTNPATSGKLPLVASSTNASSLGSVGLLADRIANSWYSNDVVNQWIAFDVGTGISVSQYTIQNRTQDNTNLMRNWVLEGSSTVGTLDVSGVNAATWVAIDTRINDASLVNAGQSVTYTCNAFSTTKYRYIRLRQNGLNNSGLNFLCLGELEFYGTLT